MVTLDSAAQDLALSLAAATRKIIQDLDDPNRDGLRETSNRHAKFLIEFLQSGKDLTFTTFPAEGMDEMVVVSRIPFYSLCEHHLVPFFGYAAVGYIPTDRIVGLSKLARVVDFYARGFQNQERITSQIVDRVVSELSPIGAGAIIQAEHLCMAMRGIRKPGAITTTSKMYGQFKADASCRAEFLKLAGLR